MPAETGELLGSFVRREMLNAIAKFGLNRRRIKITQTPNRAGGAHTFAVGFDSQPYGLGGTQTTMGGEFHSVTIPGGGSVNQSSKSLEAVIAWFNELKPKIAAKARELAVERGLKRPEIMQSKNAIKVTLRRGE